MAVMLAYAFRPLPYGVRSVSVMVAAARPAHPVRMWLKRHLRCPKWIALLA